MLAKVDSIQELKVNGEVISNSQNVADFLNKLFLSIVDNNAKNNPINSNKPLDYLRQAFNHSFPSIKYHGVITSEIAEIIKNKRAHMVMIKYQPKY
jgi:hypothetical protein